MSVVKRPVDSLLVTGLVHMKLFKLCDVEWRFQQLSFAATNDGLYCGLYSDMASPHH